MGEKKGTGTAKRPAQRRPPARRRSETNRVKVAVVAVVAAVVIAGVGFFAFASAGDTSNAQTEPASFDLPEMNGDGRIRLADYAGKPLVVNFFASWCTACDFELPGFAKVSEELRDEVQFVGVASLETGDPNFMPERHGITWWPLARDVEGSQNSGLHDALGGGNRMPMTAYYNAEGQVLEVDVSAIDEDALREKLREHYGVDV